MSETVQLLHGVLVLPEGVVDDGALLLDGPTIAYAGSAAGAPDVDGTARVPLPAGTLLLPGLVDLHCHGGGGGEFGAEEGSARQAAQHHHRAGTTSVVASLVSASPEALVGGMETCARLADAGVVAGVHLEGPFLAPGRCGAHDPAALRPVDLDLVDRLAATGRGHWRQMTYAPELDAGHALVRRLAAAGVVPAVGHTDADAPTVARALRIAADGLHGRRPLVTHLFNAMPSLHHRAPGPVAAALTAAARGEAVVELVADGVHLDDDVVTTVLAAAAEDAVVFVSDAMSACGRPDGSYRLGRLDVVVSGGVARLAEGGAIAGGTSTLLDQVRRAVRTGVPLATAVRCASAAPAAALGLPGVGALRPGHRADLLALGADLSLLAVWRGGRRL